VLNKFEPVNLETDKKELIKIIYLVIILIPILIIYWMLELIQLHELFLFTFQHLKLGVNFGRILHKKQIKKLLELLYAEDDEYGVKERRINIYAYRWQFILVYLSRNILAYISGMQQFKKLSEDIIENDLVFIMARYCHNNNLIEVFEFNLKDYCKENNISEREFMIKTILHEYRHKYQVNTKLELDKEEKEIDADRFAEEFYNRNMERIEEILLVK